MRHAFIIPNPRASARLFQPTIRRRRNHRLNKDVPYSLLECPGKYTVQVATFRGNAVIRQNDIQDIEEGREQMKSNWPLPPRKRTT